MLQWTHATSSPVVKAILHDKGNQESLRLDIYQLLYNTPSLPLGPHQHQNKKLKNHPLDATCPVGVLQVYHCIDALIV